MRQLISRVIDAFINGDVQTTNIFFKMSMVISPE